MDIEQVNEILDKDRQETKELCQSEQNEADAEYEYLSLIAQMNDAVKQAEAIFPGEHPFNPEMFLREGDL